ncbi:AAA family ATPase [Pseudomonas capsici]|uniref:AAA family ATPase n=1 Tax=Pseudomonas capsici TaxID=2810614 RepID=UPI00191017B5|nr:AAA family ATPase [Pseudomonas capsici]MBX8475050.1 SPOR domain-containing protein [Pseudomonas cichorii]MBN6713703.1 SPOR domain-containing protein [Pseudomonas capsici]MBN6719074.1 SPOR domain-containing protein [Pseudomonas capsici]MBN6723863.1 SPOR domain-containing protein [Pseudomonas capsici]MBX8613026.1 SPOR domain-containing protein [Pseudomonas cichorii]
MTSLHADEAFLGHYQLSHDPFAARVPGFKFFPAQRKSVLGQLHHLARYSQLLLAVTGPQGSGKTLLRQALVASTNKQSVQSVVISARGASDAAGVLQQVAQALIVAQAEMQAILAQIVQLALTGQEVYLLVDDAEQLGDSALEALLGLAAGTPEGRPHVFLFGEPSLIDRLDQLCADLQGDVEGERFHVIELQPYTEEETREYLAQRLEGAGQGIALFTAEQITDIHEQSDGWPGNINQVARDSMIEAMIASRSAVKRPSVGFNMPKKHVLALGAVVVVAVAAAVLIPGRGDKSAAPANAPAQAQLPLGQGTPANQQSNNGGPAIEFAGNSQPMPLPLVGNSQPVMRGPLAEAAGAGDSDEDAVPMGSPAQPATVTTTAPPAGAQAGAVPRSSIPAPAAATPVVPPAPAAKPAPAPTQVATAKPAPAAAPAAKPAEKPAAAAAKPAAGGNWYSGQAPGHYVVQILGTSSEATAQAYVAEQGGEYRYFKKTLQGKPLYVVTYGNFSDRAAALAAIKVLPAKVQAGKPWPRTVASIQQELGATR